MAIIKTQAFFHSTDNKFLIRTLIWKDSENEPAALLQIAPGLTDHINRYDRFARYLAQNGFVVCGNDHIGHGKSVKSMEELGDFGAPDAGIRMVDDMHVLHNIMRKRYPYIPFFLLGHDMGSFLARIYAVNFGDDIAGLILCGTAQIGGKISELRDYADVIADFMGKEKYSYKGSEIMGKLTSRYYKEDDESAWLSVSKENRQEAEVDPYFDFPITNASAANVIKLALKCSSDEWFSEFPAFLPVFLASGAKDPVGFFGKGVIKLCDKLEDIGVNVDMMLYPGLRHEILNEDDYSYIYEDILNWMNKNIQGDFV